MCVFGWNSDGDLPRPRGFDGSGFHVQIKVASARTRGIGVKANPMHVMSTKATTLETLLKLGRVSNLPTVWTNVLAGTVLAAGAVQGWRTGLVVLAMSLLYIGGMYLNDYFDRAIDANERPQRPIPAGDISAATVCGFGFGMLGLGVVLLGAAALLAVLMGAFLALAIVLYDAFHKDNPVAPVIMGLCRALVYCGAAAVATASVPVAIVIAACSLLAYVAGLTYAARQESFDRVGNLWPLVVLMAPMLLALPALANGVVAGLVYLALTGCAAYAIYLLAARPMPGAVPRAVGLLIAGISLVDAALLAAAGHVMPALAATLGFPATLLLQRYIPGT
jgi:UbiA prenyltransferase family